MSNKNNISVLDVDSIVSGSVDRTAFDKLPAIKKLRIYYHAQEIVKIVQSHSL
jgi:hypothetical protein